MSKAKKIKVQEEFQEIKDSKEEIAQSQWYVVNWEKMVNPNKHTYEEEKDNN